MKHIVHVSNDFEPLSSGINTHLKNLLPSLAELGFKISLLVPTASDSIKENIHREIKASNYYSIIRSYYQDTKNPISKLYQLTRSTQKGLQWIQNNVGSIDIIHQHDQRATRLGASRFAYLQDIPNIWTNHSADYFGRNGFFMRMLLNFLYLKPDGFIAVHRSMALLLDESQFKDISVRYIPNGVNLEDFKKTSEHSEKKTVVLFPQRLVPMKGPEILAKAAVEILSNHIKKEISFWLAGSERSSNRDKSIIEQVKEILMDYHDGNRVKYLGNPSYEEMPVYYQKADIVVLPLQVETENISVFEAWASGTPLITTEQVEKNGYMKQEKNCLIVPNKDPIKLAEAIVRLAKDVNLRHTLAENGRDLVEKRFTWSHAAEKTVVLYREILNDRKE